MLTEINHHGEKYIYIFQKKTCVSKKISIEKWMRNISDGLFFFLGN